MFVKTVTKEFVSQIIEDELSQFQKKKRFEETEHFKRKLSQSLMKSKNII